MLGLEVFTDEGTLLGYVEDIYNTGSNDIYVVKNDLGKQILLPAISDVIKQIDSEIVTFMVNKDSSPTMVKEIEREDYYYIIMPMSIGEE